MGYIDNNLITSEHVTYRARLHWIIFIKPALVTAGLLAIGALSFYAKLNGWIGGGFLLAAIIPIVVARIARNAAEFAATNKRVILKVGFIQNKTAEMFLNKIESVGVNQSILGRVFGYGTIVIRGTGGSLEPFDRISAPLEFRKQIQEQIGQAFGEPISRSASTSGNSK